MDWVNLVLDKDGDMTAKEKLFVVYFVSIWWNWSNPVHGAKIQAHDTQYLLRVCDPQDFSTKPTNKRYRFIHRCEFWYRNMSRLVYALPVLNLKNKFYSNLQRYHCMFLICLEILFLLFNLKVVHCKTIL